MRHLTPLKFLLICLLTVLSLPAVAYNDHRNARVDSLEAALKSSNPPKGARLLSAYEELMRGYLPFDAQKAEDYGRKALALSYELNDLSTRQYVLRHFGLLRYGSEDFDGALKFFDHALAVADSMEQSGKYTQLNIDDARSSLYGSIANVYNLQGKAHLAIHYYQLAQPLFERNGWLESQSILHLNIAELYLGMGNLEQAEQHFLQAIEKGRESGDSLMVAGPQKGLANVYMQSGKYEDALENLQASHAYYKNHRKEDPIGYALALTSLARIHLMEGHQDLSAAQAYAQEAASLITPQMPFEEQGEIYMACCQVAMARSQWQEALDYGLRTIHPDFLVTDADAIGYKLLADIYIHLGQKEKASEMLDKLHQAMSRYATQHYQSGLSQMEVLYETERKEAQIKSLDEERKRYSWLLVGACVGLLLLALLLIYRQLAHRRQKALLAAKVALETETKERHILARDLHDSLGGMLSLLRLKIEEKDPKALSLLDDTMGELRRVSHHLMPEELLRSGLVPALHDFAVSIPGAKFQAIGDIQLSREQELVLYRCAYELVNNALKHAQATQIGIQLMQEGREVTLTVSDDGKGLAGTSTDGMGLQNIRERIEPYQGQLHILSQEGEGTEINLTLYT